MFKRLENYTKTNNKSKFIINGHEYVDLGLLSGLKWVTCNVGANSPEEYGNYYAWGETETKDENTIENSSALYKQMSDISGNPQYDVARKKWGSNWKMPTYVEMEELLNECIWEYIICEYDYGAILIYGYKVIGPNGNSIFIPSAGHCSETLHNSTMSAGRYWSSTCRGGRSTRAYGLYFSKNTCRISGFRNYYGRSVRPVLE